VFDLDSIGLLSLVNGLNQGVDPAGKITAGQTHFFLATGAEPSAVDYQRELSRLKKKVAAGARLIMTQPVYSIEVATRFEGFLSFDLSFISSKVFSKVFG
jgi:5,10-methylenetetrahydrofolate reductase